MHDGGHTAACATWGWRAGETSHSERHMDRGPGASIARGARGEAIEADVQRVTQRLSPQGWGAMRVRQRSRRTVSGATRHKGARP